MVLATALLLLLEAVEKLQLVEEGVLLLVRLVVAAPWVVVLPSMCFLSFPRPFPLLLRLLPPLHLHRHRRLFSS
jgi:hypothetical protein